MCGSTVSHPLLLIFSFLAANQKGLQAQDFVMNRMCDPGTPATYKYPFSKTEFYPCDALLNLGDSGHIIPPGVEEHGHYDKRVLMSWYLHTTNPKKELIVLCPTHIDMTNGDILFFHEIYNVVGNELRTPYAAPDPIYYHKGLVPEERDDIIELMSMPCQVIERGRIIIGFETTATNDSLTSWDVLYFARSSVKNRPQEGMRVPVSSTVQQVAIPENVKEFTWEVDEGERIWIQVVHMDLTTNVSDILHTGDCSTNPSRVEIYERNCSTNSCMLALLCRNPFNMTPVTLVTEGNYAHVRMFCNQPPGKDCATINYKLYEPEEDIGSCPKANDTATNQTYDPLAGDQYSNLTHSYDQGSSSNGTTKVWRLENINHNETAITVEENSMSLSPDCSKERVSIYSGPCIRPENLVTYFCGGMTDTYKLTTSKYTTVVFNGPKLPTSGRSFKIVINAGPQPPPPPPLVIIVITGDVESETSEQQSDMVFILVGAVLIFTILVIIPAVITFVKKAIRPAPAVMPTDPSLGPGFAAMGPSFTVHRENQTVMLPPSIDDLPPPYPGSATVVKAPASIEATLGLPQFPRQPSAVSIYSTEVIPIPSIASFGEPDMCFSIAPSRTLSVSEESEVSLTQSNRPSTVASDDSSVNRPVSSPTQQYQPDKDLSSTKSDSPIQVPRTQSPVEQEPEHVHVEKKEPQAAYSFSESPIKEYLIIATASSETIEEQHTTHTTARDQAFEAMAQTQESVPGKSDTEIPPAKESGQAGSEVEEPQAIEPQSVPIPSTVQIPSDVQIIEEVALPNEEAQVDFTEEITILPAQDAGQMPFEQPLSVSSTSVLTSKEALYKQSESNIVHTEEPSVQTPAPVPIPIEEPLGPETDPVLIHSEEHLVSEPLPASVPTSMEEPLVTAIPVRISTEEPLVQVPVTVSVEEPLAQALAPVPIPIEEPLAQAPAPVPIPIQEPLAQAPAPVPIPIQESLAQAQALVPIPTEEPQAQAPASVPIPIEEPLAPEPAPVPIPVEEPLVPEQDPVPVTKEEPILPLQVQELSSIKPQVIESIISPIQTGTSTTQKPISAQIGVPESEVETVKQIPPFSQHIPKAGSEKTSEQSESIGPSMSGLGQLPSLGTDESGANIEYAEAAGVTEVASQSKGKKKRRKSSIKGSDVEKVTKGRKGKKGTRRKSIQQK